MSDFEKSLEGLNQGWEYLGTHPLGKSYLVVSYLGKDKSYLVSKLVVCIVVSPALTGKTYVSRILGRILGSILVLPAQIPPVCGCATSSNVPLLKRCWGRSPATHHPSTGDVMARPHGKAGDWFWGGLIDCTDI